jgi:hypothetical protein
MPLTRIVGSRSLWRLGRNDRKRTRCTVAQIISRTTRGFGIDLTDIENITSPPTGGIGPAPG